MIHNRVKKDEHYVKYTPGDDIGEFIREKLPVVFFIPKNSEVNWHRYDELSKSPYKSGLSIKELVKGRIPPDTEIAFKMKLGVNQTDPGESKIIVRMSVITSHELSPPINIKVYLMTNGIPRLAQSLMNRAKEFKSILLESVLKHHEKYDPKHDYLDDSRIWDVYDDSYVDFVGKHGHHKEIPHTGKHEGNHLSMIAAPLSGNDYLLNQKEISVEEALKSFDIDPIKVKLDPKSTIRIKGVLVKVARKTLQTRLASGGKEREILGTKETHSFRLDDIITYADNLSSKVIARKLKSIESFGLPQKSYKSINGKSVEWSLFSIKKELYDPNTISYSVVLSGYVSGVVGRQRHNEPRGLHKVKTLPIDSILFVATELDSSAIGNTKFFSSSNIDYDVEEQMNEKVQTEIPAPVKYPYEITSREEMFRQLFIKSRENSLNLYVTVNMGPIFSTLLGFTQSFTDNTDHFDANYPVNQKRMLISVESWSSFAQYEPKSVIGTNGEELSSALYNFSGESRVESTLENVQREYTDSASLKVLSSDFPGSVVYKVIDVRIDGLVIRADYAFKNATDSGAWDVISNPEKVELKSEPVLFVRFDDVSIFGSQVFSASFPPELRRLMLSKTYRFFGYTGKEYATLVAQWLVNANNNPKRRAGCIYRNKEAILLSKLRNNTNLRGLKWNVWDLNEKSTVLYYDNFDDVKMPYYNENVRFSIGSINIDNGTAVVYRIFEPSVTNGGISFGDGDNNNTNALRQSKKVASNTVDVLSLDLTDSIPFFSKPSEIYSKDILSRLSNYKPVHNLISDYLKVYEKDENIPVIDLKKGDVYDLCSNPESSTQYEIYNWKDVLRDINEDKSTQEIKREECLISLSASQIRSLGMNPGVMLKGSLSPKVLNELHSLPSSIIDIDVSARKIILCVYFAGIPLELLGNVPPEFRHLNSGYTIESATVQLPFSDFRKISSITGLLEWKSKEEKMKPVNRFNGPPLVIVSRQYGETDAFVTDKAVGSIAKRSYNSLSDENGNTDYSINSDNSGGGGGGDSGSGYSNDSQKSPVESVDIDKLISEAIKTKKKFKISQYSKLRPLFIKVVDEDNRVHFQSFKKWLSESGINSENTKLSVDISDIKTRTGEFTIEKYNKTTGRVGIASSNVLSIILPGADRNCRMPVNASMKFSTMVSNLPSLMGDTSLISCHMHEMYGGNDDQKYKFTKLDIVRVQPEYGTKTLPRPQQQQQQQQKTGDASVINQSGVDNLWSIRSEYKDSVSGGMVTTTDNIHIPAGINDKYQTAILKQFKKQANKQERTVYVPTTLEENPLPYKILNNVPYIYKTYPEKSAATKVSNDIVNLYSDTQNISITIVPGVSDVILGCLGAVFNWGKVAAFLTAVAVPYIVSGAKQENLGWGNALSKNARKWRKAVTGMYLKRFKGLSKDKIALKFASDLEKEIASKLSNKEAARKYLLTRSVEELLVIPKPLVLLMYKLKLLNQDAMDQLRYEKYISTSDIDNYVIPPEIPREAIDQLLGGNEGDDDEPEEISSSEKEKRVMSDIPVNQTDDINPKLVGAISLGLGLGGGFGFGTYAGYDPYYPAYGPYYKRRYPRRHRAHLNAGINVGIPVTPAPYYIGSHYSDYKTLAPLLDYQKVGIVPLVVAPVAAATAGAAIPWLAIAIFGAAVISATGLIASKVLPGMLDRWVIKTGGIRQVATNAINKAKRGVKNIVLLLKGKNKEERLKILTDDALERSRKMSPKERANIIASQSADNVLMLDEEVIKSLIENNLLTDDQYTKIIASKKYPSLENIDVSMTIYNPKYVEDINSKPTSYWRAQPQSVIIPLITRCTFTGPYMDQLIEDGIVKTSELQGVDCWRNYLLEYRKKKKSKKSTKKSSSKSTHTTNTSGKTEPNPEETSAPVEVNPEQPKETTISADIYHLSKGFTVRDNYLNDPTIGGTNLEDDTPPKEYLLKVLNSMKLDGRDVLKHFDPFIFSIKKSSELFANGYQGGVVVLSLKKHGLKRETVIDPERVRMMVFVLRNVESGGCVSGSLFFREQSLEPTRKELWDSLHKTYATNEEYEWYKLKKFAEYRVKSRMFMHIGGPGISTPEDCNQFIDFVFSTLGDLGLSEISTPIIIKSKSISSNIKCRNHCKNIGLTQKPGEPNKWYADEYGTKTTYAGIVKSISSPYYHPRGRVHTPTGYTSDGVTTFIDTGLASSQTVDMSDARMYGNTSTQRSPYFISSSIDTPPKYVIVQRPLVTTMFGSDTETKQPSYVMRQLYNDSTTNNTTGNPVMRSYREVSKPMQNREQVYRSNNTSERLVDADDDPNTLSRG